LFKVTTFQVKKQAARELIRMPVT